MKKVRYLISLILFLIITTSTAFSQPELGRSSIEIKTAEQARGLAATNTLMPLAVGVGTVALFENNTIQTVGAAMALYGLAMGPSTGNFYADDYTRGLLGLLTRAAGGYLMVDATSEIFGSRFEGALNVDNKSVSLTDTKIIIGEVLIIGSIIYNIISAGNSVAEYNALQGQRIRVTVEPSEGPFSSNYAPVITGKIYL